MQQNICLFLVIASTCVVLACSPKNNQIPLWSQRSLRESANISCGCCCISDFSPNRRPDEAFNRDAAGWFFWSISGLLRSISIPSPHPLTRALTRCSFSLSCVFLLAAMYQQSCEEYKHRGKSSGSYWIDPDGSGPVTAFQVTCDMSGERAAAPPPPPHLELLLISQLETIFLAFRIKFQSLHMNSFKTI